MLSTRFSTLESVLSNLDTHIAESQEVATSTQQQLTQIHAANQDQHEARVAHLKTHLVGVFQNDAAAQGEIGNLPESVQSQALETYEKVKRLNQAKEFGSLVRQVDALKTSFNEAPNLEKKADVFAKMRPILFKIRDTPFNAAKDELTSELEALIAPTKAQALSDLEKSLGSEWPNKNPTSLQFTEALSVSFKLDDDSCDGDMESFNTLCKALDLRFKFNFESEQKTRRFDKPEWLFYFFSKSMDPHIEWLKTTVQPILAEAFPNDLAVNAFTSALLPSVFRAAKLYLDNCKHDPEMLNHFLQESFKFDQTLVDKYYYFYSENWLGLTTTCLVNDETAFQSWLSFEKESAMETFNELANNEQSWNIDYDSADTNITSRSTALGLGFTSLFDSITDLYHNLKLARLQLLFVNDIQLTLVDKYFSVLKQRKNHPQADLDDYGKVLGSIGYFIDFLHHRNSYLIFIDLQASISSEGGLFDNVIDMLVAFRKTCIEEINNMLRKGLSQLFKQYSHKRDVNTEEGSHQLHSPVGKLSKRLKFFSEICNPVDYTTIKVSLGESLATYFMKSVIQSSSFNAQQGLSLKMDLQYVWEGLDLNKGPSYKQLLACAEYFETGERPEGLGEDLFGSIERRRFG